MAVALHSSGGVARARSNPPTYKIVATTNGQNATIYLYDVIGADMWFGGGISADQFRKDLAALGAVKNIDLRINSEGGSVIDAQAMYNLLVQHPATITTHVDGLAASAASFIAMAGKTIEVAESSYMMIHNASGGVRGTAADMRRTADTLDMVCAVMCKLYSDRSGQPMDQVREWMDAETWMTGQECVDRGFATKMMPNMAAAACVREPAKFGYQHLPAALRSDRVRAAAAIHRMTAAIA